MSEQYHVIGLMSGTSLDGLDMAYCTFNKIEGKWRYELLASRQIPYDAERANQLKHAINLPTIELFDLNIQYGRWLGKQVKEFINDKNLSVDFVASHGHTVFHQPEKGYTYQIGSGAELSKSIGYPVVCDFRSLDVTMGGQGAPLVPIGDQLLFSQYDFCLNLGGIANVSFVKSGQRVAFDIGLANMLLNHFANDLGLAYDHDGKIASQGKINEPLLSALNNLDYYSQPYPKSIGYEWFVDEVKPLLESSSINNQDKMATGVAHITQMIASAVLEEWTEEREGLLLTTGGGARNSFLIRQLSKELGDRIQVVVPNEDLIDYKESIVFALMGILRMRDEPNCLASVTGAINDVSGGLIYRLA